MGRWIPVPSPSCLNEIFFILLCNLHKFSEFFEFLFHLVLSFTRQIIDPTLIYPNYYECFNFTWETVVTMLKNALKLKKKNLKDELRI